MSNIIPNLSQGTFTWERSLFAPVEGVNWVRPGKHGKPRGDEELEVGWPRYSGWHSLASFGITANVKVFNCLVFTLFWLQLMLLLFSLLFNSIKCLSFLVDRIEVGFTYLRKKMMILVTIFPVGNWWLTTWEYLQNSNNPTVQLIIENSSAAPRAKKNGRNLSSDTFPHFQLPFMCAKTLHYCFIIYKCMTFWVNFPPPVEAEDSLPRNGFNDPMDKRLLGRFLHIFSKNPHDANLINDLS